ncbi:DUF63 family protein [Halobacterium sp. CBA1126]|uniref:DUF63 family protein n=1 Tax=Halobacterium sp. CBA1126 TaxID=2668074 RepID=UPI0012FCFEDA|nr:DUF63 family protein [Halobacterium sp. CBA1126]MUV59620.1 DUF63 family protein [Halobacterium sp. CBA1126]
MTFPETDRERAWTALVAVAVAALAAGSLLFPDTVYGGFVWHYFWGPVVADANGAHCAAWNGGAVELLYDAGACSAAAEPVAYPGYTLVSEVGYAVTLLVSLVGVTFLLDNLEVGEDLDMLYALFPFVLLGGALRVVEDANDAAAAAPGVEQFLSFPANTLIISPIIYFVMFAITLVALVACVALARRTDAVDGYLRPLAGVGTALLLATVGFLVYLAVSTDYVSLLPQFTLLTLLFATIITAGVWYVVRRRLPEVASGTEFAGAVVLWGHAVDGVANVIGLDWADELGLPYDLVPKHPVNAAVVDITQDVLPASIIHYTGDAWPFLVLKVVAALFVLWLFDARLREDAPRYFTLMLVAVLAVGLGPGSRDMLRATFGI